MTVYSLFILLFTVIFEIVILRFFFSKPVIFVICPVHFETIIWHEETNFTTFFILALRISLMSSYKCISPRVIRVHACSTANSYGIGLRTFPSATVAYLSTYVDRASWREHIAVIATNARSKNTMMMMMQKTMNKNNRKKSWLLHHHNHHPPPKHRVLRMTRARLVFRFFFDKNEN